MPYPVMPLGFLGSQGDQDTYRIESSLRFNSADSAYFNRTPSSASNTKLWTFSVWLKPTASFANERGILAARRGAGNGTTAFFTTSGNLEFTDYTGSYQWRLITSQVFRDPSSWYHFVFVYDSDNATSSLRSRIYVNGSEITNFSTSTYPSSGYVAGINSNVEQRIGADYSTSPQGFDGYMTEAYLIDGQALTPSSFGETDAITGRWKAKAYSGTYGTNGFYLNFADNSGVTSTTLGKDSSPNGNNWTPNNFSVTAGAGNDSLVDSPTNYGADAGVGGEVRGNYCTINPLEQNSSTEADGNLQVTMAANDSIRGSMYVSSGKWYYEVEVTTQTNPYIGLASNAGQPASYTTNNAFGVNENGDIFEDNVVQTEDSIAVVANSIYSVAFDADAKLFWFGKGGQWYSCDRTPDVTINVSDILSGNFGYDFSGIGGNAFAPHFGNSTNAGNIFKVNFGQRPWEFPASVPSGFKALCTTNLPQPTIQKPSSAMDVVTYTGNGSARSITGLGFSPDLVWIKGRSGATDHAIYDSVRGVQLDLGSNLTTDETTQTQGLTAFNSDGFNIGTLAKINTNAATYVAWAWDEAAIDGVDIVSYTGNGANRTISHNLGLAPKMIIVKARTTAGADQGWPVYHASNTSAPETDYLLLNSTAATADLNTVWNDTAPTASVFSVGTNALVNTNNDTYIAYLFAEVEGFSKFGSYTGNGSADGPFVWCGFRPRWVMAKSATGANNWHLYDAVRNTANVCDNDLLPNSSSAEVTASPFIDILSNGFKVRASGVGFNGSGATFIFAAFAESPFKYARAR